MPFTSKQEMAEMPLLGPRIWWTDATLFFVITIMYSTFWLPEGQLLLLHGYRNCKRAQLFFAREEEEEN